MEVDTLAVVGALLEQQALPLLSSIMRLLAPIPPEARSGAEGTDDAGSGDMLDDGNALAVHHADIEDKYTEEKPPPTPTPPSTTSTGYTAPRPRPAGFAVGGRTRNGPNVRAVGSGG